MKLTFRPGVLGDALDLARFVNMAGDGLAAHFWEKSKAPGQDIWDLGTDRARRPKGSFSYTRATMAICEGRTAGAIVRYPITQAATASDYATMPETFVPIQQLEDLAVGSNYVSVLAVYPRFQGRGTGRALMQQTATRDDQTLVVSDANTDAMRLYTSLGFEVVATRCIIKGDWNGSGDNWYLMRKPAVSRRAVAAG